MKGCLLLAGFARFGRLFRLVGLRGNNIAGFCGGSVAGSRIGGRGSLFLLVHGVIHPSLPLCRSNIANARRGIVAHSAAIGRAILPTADLGILHGIANPVVFVIGLARGNDRPGVRGKRGLASLGWCHRAASLRRSNGAAYILLPRAMGCNVVTGMLRRARVNTVVLDLIRNGRTRAMRLTLVGGMVTRTLSEGHRGTEQGECEE